MMSGIKIILKIVLLLVLMSSYEAADSLMCRNGHMPVTEIVNSLGFKLEQMIEPKENYFFSPLSISVALAMVYMGARGTTREQMSEALEYNVVGKNCLPNKISESFHALISSIQKEGNDYSLLIANGAFLQKSFQISHYYSWNLERFFNSNIRYLNFAEEETASMEKINEWVANYTKGKISQLLVEPLDPLTVMVLINAIYFKGLWEQRFNESLTEKGLFMRIDNSPKTVPFMVMEDKLYIYHDTEKGYSALELEYEGNNISMILILPDNVREFPRYELTSESLCTLRSKLQYLPVTLTMPKFNMEFKRELSKDMIRLGMGELFSDRADLTGIRERNDLHVSVMVHKAVIEVNEKGSLATSVLGLGIDGRNKLSMETFKADHPFLFYIIHRKTNTILFSGRVLDP